MGGAVAAISGGTHAIQWNPAGIGRATVPMAQVNLGLKPSTTDVQLNTSVLYPFEDGTVFSLAQFSDFPYAPFSNTNYIASAAVPLNSTRDVFLGMNLKYIALSTLSGTTANNGRGIGLDLGLNYDIRNSQGVLVSLACVIKDIATEVRFSNAAEEASTRTFVLGAAYQNIKDTRVEMDFQIVDQTLQGTSLHNRLRLGAERFFQDRNFSARLGFDDLFNSNGYISAGMGYHPSEPFEISYALRISESDSAFSNFLSFIYRFDDLKSAELVEKGPSSEIYLASAPVSTSISRLRTGIGRPISGVPLRKMTIQLDPPIFSPGGKQKTTNITFPGDKAGDITGWEVAITNQTGKTVRRIEGSGPLSPLLVWDGVNDEGKQVEEGKYRIALRTYNSRNELLSDDFEPLEVVSLRFLFSLLASSSYFSSHANKKRKDILFTIHSGGSPEVEIGRANV